MPRFYTECPGCKARGTLRYTVIEKRIYMLYAKGSSKDETKGVVICGPKIEITDAKWTQTWCATLECNWSIENALPVSKSVIKEEPDASTES